jgi:hypothetical protein
MFRFIAERGSLVEALVSVSPLTVLKNRNGHQVETGRAGGLKDSGAGEGNRTLVISLGTDNEE